MGLHSYQMEHIILGINSWSDGLNNKLNACFTVTLVSVGACCGTAHIAVVHLLQGNQ